MISRFDDLAVSPEPYADYRRVFETSRLNVTCVRVWPGQTVPAHTHLDEDQIYHVLSGSGHRLHIERRHIGGLTAERRERWCVARHRRPARCTLPPRLLPG